MNKKRIRIVIAIVIVLGLGRVLCKQTIPDKHIPADNSFYIDPAASGNGV